MENLEIDGKNYISAKRAAKENSYTPDYIGQLIRASKLIGKKVGRSWYVEEESLNAFLKERAEGSQHEYGVTSIPEVTAGTSLVGEEKIKLTPVEKTEEKVSVEVAEEKIPVVAAVPVTIGSQVEEVQAPSYELLRYVADDAPVLPILHGEIKSSQDDFSEAHEIKLTRESVNDDGHNSSETIVEVRGEEMPEIVHVTQVQRPAREGRVVRETRLQKRSSFLPTTLTLGVSVALIAVLISIGMSLTKVVTYDGSATSASIGISNIRDSK